MISLHKVLEQVKLIYYDSNQNNGCLKVGWEWERVGGKFLGVIHVFCIRIRV